MRNISQDAAFASKKMENHALKTKNENETTKNDPILSKEEKERKEEVYNRVHKQCKKCSTVCHIFILRCPNPQCGRQFDRPRDLQDWTCLKCNYLIFAKKDRCAKCHSRRDDWKCEHCACINFASRIACYKCKIDKPQSRFVIL